MSFSDSLSLLVSDTRWLEDNASCRDRDDQLKKKRFFFTLKDEPFLYPQKAIIGDGVTPGVRPEYTNTSLLFLFFTEHSAALFCSCSHDSRRIRGEVLILISVAFSLISVIFYPRTGTDVQRPRSRTKCTRRENHSQSAESVENSFACHLSSAHSSIYPSVR